MKLVIIILSLTIGLHIVNHIEGNHPCHEFCKILRVCK